MKKSSIPLPSLVDRRIFLKQLSLAGWDVDGWEETLDIGADVKPEAEAHYAGPVFDLRLEYHADKGHLVLEMVQEAGDLFLRLYLYPKIGLPKLLSKIIKMKDALNEENFPDLVTSLIPLCDPLLIDTDEGLQKLA